MHNKPYLQVERVGKDFGEWSFFCLQIVIVVLSCLEE